MEKVRQHYLCLVEQLDLKFSGLLDHLYADGVVDCQEMEDIWVQHTSVRQNEKLLCLLSRKSVEQFQTFLQDLDKSGQRHIRNTLENRQGFLALLLHMMMMMMKLPILLCAEKLEPVLSTAPKTSDNTDKDSKNRKRSH